MKNSFIIEMRKVGKAFAKATGEPLPALSDITLSLREGEILGLLGRSGSGKSTLLRVAAGLIAPTSGEVLYRGKPLDGPTEGIAVVFQSFALFPWLTVLENVEAGLDAVGLAHDEARRRAMSAIDLIGLDGFQSAYPRELSGGMRQRVGFARAIVIQPILLLMDEPFSALDVLTAETLRTDFLDLWIEHQLPTKSVLLVTHNIEEAVMMCDRILVLASNPGRIAAEIPVSLPHPRNRLDNEFHGIVDEFYSILTARATASIGAQSQIHGGFLQPLPPVQISLLIGFIEVLAAPPYDGYAELARLSGGLALGARDFFPIAEALHLLEFAELKDGAIKLTAAGRVFAQSATDERKRLFNEHLVQFVPLAAHIRHVLNDREGHLAPRVRFESELEDHLNPSDAEKTLRAVIGWGRYAELFTYDDESRTFKLNAADLHKSG
ncbi:MAG TPA: nitrate/sulfonate/bicarbonate ABC transporter ATP-binding protein [Candidatus Binataceae bacterium]|nr:nitrate/sulfonate/bicarbonate ABC transporter ATP-binding protein [Candidatus Binataceae bacterium]